MSVDALRTSGALAYSPAFSPSGVASSSDAQVFGDIVTTWKSDRDGDKATAFVYSASDDPDNTEDQRLLAVVEQDLEADTVRVIDVTANDEASSELGDTTLDDIAAGRDVSTSEFMLEDGSNVSEFKLDDGKVVQTAGQDAQFIENQYYSENSHGNINFPSNGEEFVQLQIANPDGPSIEELDPLERATDYGGVGIQIGLDDGYDPESLKTVIHTREIDEDYPDYPDFKSFTMEHDFLGGEDFEGDPNRILMEGSGNSFTTPKPPKEDTTDWYNPTTWGDNSNERWYNPFSWGWFDGQ